MKELDVLQKAEVLLPKRPLVEKCPICDSKMKLVNAELSEYYCWNCGKYFTTELWQIFHYGMAKMEINVLQKAGFSLPKKHPVRKLNVQHWLANLPWKLTQVLICDLFGHKPALDLEFIPNLTICERCMAPLKKSSGIWSGDFAIFDLKSGVCRE